MKRPLDLEESSSGDKAPAQADSVPSCSICMESPSGDINQCTQGHLICTGCFDHYTEGHCSGEEIRCPTCKSSMPRDPKARIRNRLAEQIIESSPAACEHCGFVATRGRLASTHSPCPAHTSRKVSTTFGDGRTVFFEGVSGREVHVRTEFAEGHAEHGRINHFERGENVRTEYCGKILHYEKGEHVRTEFAEGHANHGVIMYYANHEHVRQEYRGQIFHYEKGEHVRTEFAEGDVRHGQIQHFEKGWCIRTEWAFGNANHGVIMYYVNHEHVRTEFVKGHESHGAIHYYENGENVRTEFAEVAGGQAGARRVAGGKRVGPKRNGRL